jgi:hypothetical protein
MKNVVGMLHRVALVRTDVSEKPITSIIWVTRIGELGTLAVTSNRRTLRPSPVFSSEAALHINTSRLCDSVNDPVLSPRWG